MNVNLCNRLLEYIVQVTKHFKLCLYVYSVMRYSNFKVREQCFFSLLQNSKKISKIRDQNIPILSEKCYNSGLQHDTCLYYVANERSVCRLSN